MEDNKKRNLGIILGISILLVMVIGVTYAAFQYTKSGTKENELSTGTVSFKYNETSNGVTLNNAYPMSDNEGKAMQQGASGEEGENGYFDFDVTSTLGGDMEIQYYVYAVDITGNEENKLDTQFVKVYLTDQSSPENPYEGYDSEVPVYSDLEDITTTTEEEPVEGKLLYQNKFTSSGEHKYRLRLWVSNDYETDEVAKIFKMRVDVNTDVKIIPKDQNKPTCTVENVSKEVIGKDEDVTMTIKCTDDNGTVTSNMTSDNIHVKVDGEDVTPTTKQLDEGTSLADITGENGIQHNLTLGGFEKGGKVTFTIDSGVVTDQYENTNEEQILEPNITVDTEGPVCTLEDYFPTKTITKDKTVELTIKCTDESEITQDLTGEGLKVTVGEEEETELTKEITNTESIDTGKKYTVEVKGFTKTGKIGATINEGTLQDSLQNPNKETPLEIELEIANKTLNSLDFTEEHTNSDDTWTSGSDESHEMYNVGGGKRYIGDTPWNYLKFEGDETNTVWRIIGVFNDSSTTGNSEPKLKIVTDQSIGDKQWDSSNSNNWAKASLQTELNGTYLTSLPQVAQNKIENMKWYLGGVDSNYSSYSTEKFYSLERGSTVPNGASATWPGKVGLIYPSDYGYIYANGVGTTCYNTLSNASNCTSEKEKNWFWQNTSTHPWTLTPYSGNSLGVFCFAGTNGGVTWNNANITSHAVRPVVYLKSDTMIKDGSGQSSDPYIVSKDSAIADLDTTAPICSIELITPESPTTEEQVKIKIKCKDDSGKVKEKSKLTSDEIEVKLNGEETSATKELSSASETEGGIEYTLTLNNFAKAGSLSLTIPEGKVTDESGNTNIKTSLTIGTIWGTSGTDKFTKEHTNDSEALYSEETKHKMFEFTHETTDQTGARTDYRYIGDDPYNYVNLLGTEEGKKEKNLWRIIGVFEDPSTTEGKDGSKKIKLIRDQSLGKYSWDNANEVTYYNYNQYYYGANSWERPSALNSVLNAAFWNGTSGQCPLCSLINNGTYCQNSPTSSCDFSSNGLNSVQSKIENMKWYLGGRSNNQAGAEQFYKDERNNSILAGYAGSKAIGTGHVGLIYPSDYVYTYGAGFGTTKCFQSNSGSCNGEQTKSWMVNNDYWWTLTPDADSAYRVFDISVSTVNHDATFNSNFGVRPVVYLKSNIGITGGSGTKEDPYTVG